MIFKSLMQYIAEQNENMTELLWGGMEVGSQQWQEELGAIYDAMMDQLMIGINERIGGLSIDELVMLARDSQEGVLVPAVSTRGEGATDSVCGM